MSSFFKPLGRIALKKVSKLFRERDRECSALLGSDGDLPAKLAHQYLH